MVCEILVADSVHIRNWVSHGFMPYGIQSVFAALPMVGEFILLLALILRYKWRQKRSGRNGLFRLRFLLVRYMCWYLFIDSGYFCLSGSTF